MKNIFMFDVEAESLHGEAIAFSAVVEDTKGNEIDSLSCMLLKEQCKCCVYVNEKVMPALIGFKWDMICLSRQELYQRFYDFYMKYKETCDIYSDVNYPVETNFLEAVCMDDLDNRQWDMPYPLLDVANHVNVELSRVDFMNKYFKESELKKYIEKNGEVKEHNPYWDCKASIFLLLHSELKI